MATHVNFGNNTAAVGITSTLNGNTVTLVKTNAGWGTVMDATPTNTTVNSLRVIELKVLASQRRYLQVGFTAGLGLSAGAGDMLGTSMRLNLHTFKMNMSGPGGPALPGAPAVNGVAADVVDRRFALQLDLREGRRRLDVFWTVDGTWKHVANAVIFDQIVTQMPNWYAATTLLDVNDRVEVRCYDVTNRPAAFIVDEAPATVSSPAPTSANMVVPYYGDAKLHKLSFEDTLRLPATGVPQVNVAFIGTPNQGKSAALNALSSAIVGTATSVVVEAGPSVDGNGTRRLTRIPILKTALRNAGCTPQPGFEFVVFDMVGMRGKRELVAAMQGKLRNNQVWPMPNNPSVTLAEATEEEAADVPRAEAARQAIEHPSHALSPLDAAHCAVLFITAEDLMAGAGKSPLSAQMLEVCQDFYANVDFPIQLPKLLVVTKVDLWLANQPLVATPDCLLQGTAGPLAPLYQAAHSQLGFPGRDVIPLGWLNSTDAHAVDYSSPQAPVVVALKYLAQRMSSLACTTVSLHFTQ
jgi:hypothetical protein